MIRAGALAALLALPPLGASAEDLIGGHGISAFGELKYAEDFAHFDYVNPDAPKGGTWSGQPDSGRTTYDSFNPFILRGVGAYGIAGTLAGSFIYDSLMVRALDEPDAVYGLVAHRAEWAADRSHVTFFMRPEATFADGHPVTAEDVVFTLTALKEQGSIRVSSTLVDVLSATAIDDHTVRFEFRPGPHTRDLPMRVAALPILPAHFYEGRDFAEPHLDVPPGSGPYAIGDFQEGRYVEFDRRADYWAADLPVNVGRWNFDTIRVDYYEQRDVGFAAFRAGQITFHEEFTSKRWATEYDFAAVNDGRVIRDVLPDGRPSGTQGFWINMRRDKFADPRVREALSMAFDFEWSNRTLFYDLYTRTDSFFEGGPMEAAGAPGEAERALLESLGVELPAGALEAAWVPPVTDGSGRIRRQLRAAAALLDAAGWEIVDGQRMKDGEALTVEFLDDGPSFGRIVLPYIENLGRLGIAAEFNAIDRAQFAQRVKDYDFDVISAALLHGALSGG